ncbi:MAG: sulfite exporter TauE/SafE family protein [Fimbriimonadales bacterium]
MLPLLSVLAIGGAIIAAIAGFGIGSVLTPGLSIYVPAKLAVAAVSVPHLFATAYRLWLVRSHIDYRLLKSFGAMSAAGGLGGAVATLWLSSRALEIVLAGLLIAVGIGGLMGWTKKLRFEGVWAWLAGTVSGFLGGLVGNQGGLRAGAMMGLGVSRDAFVATATATAIVVDAARMPVYLISQWGELRALWPAIAIMSIGVLIGTFFGMSLLKRIPEERFLQVVAILLIGLGVWLSVK